MEDSLNRKLWYFTSLVILILGSHCGNESSSEVVYENFLPDGITLPPSNAAECETAPDVVHPLCERYESQYLFYSTANWPLPFHPSEVDADSNCWSSKAACNSCVQKCRDGLLRIHAYFYSSASWPDEWLYIDCEVNEDCREIPSGFKDYTCEYGACLPPEINNDEDIE
jgi:hypothetical protein